MKNFHTKYEPKTEEWKCPKCGSVDDFVLQTDTEEPPCGNHECVLLHINDHVYCSKCNYGVGVVSFVNRLIKQNNLVKCSCCDGKGFVPGVP